MHNHDYDRFDDMLDSSVRARRLVVLMAGLREPSHRDDFRDFSRGLNGCAECWADIAVELAALLAEESGAHDLDPLRAQEGQREVLAELADAIDNRYYGDE